MDPKESAKRVPEKKEPPRKCKICGGRNHYACGCEARQRAAAVVVANENIDADAKSSAIVEVLKVDEKLKSLAMDFGAAKVSAEIIRVQVEQIVNMLSDVIELLKSIHNELVKIRNGTKSAEVKNDGKN